MKGWLLAALCAVLVLNPAVLAQTTEESIWEPGEEGELQRWRIYEDNFNNGAQASFSDNATWFRFASLEKAIPQSILFVEIRLTTTIQSAEDGDWLYQFETSSNTNATWEDCSWIVPTRDPGVLGGSPVVYGTFSISCATSISQIAEDEEFTWWLNRTVDSGTPDTPEAQHLSIRMDRADFVVYPMDVTLTTTLDAYIPIIFWAGLFVWSLMRSWLLMAVWSLIGGLETFYPAFPISQTAAFVGLFLVVALQALAGGAMQRWASSRFGGDA